MQQKVSEPFAIARTSPSLNRFDCRFYGKHCLAKMFVKAVLLFEPAARQRVVGTGSTASIDLLPLISRPATPGLAARLSIHRTSPA